MAPAAIFAHGDEHSASDDYDPVDTEFGSYEPGMKVTRTIEVDMIDQMRFTPAMIEVKQGEVIRFVHTNSGQLMHEFVLGTPETLAEHAELMKRFPGMEHSEPYMAHVPPGQKGEITWKFTKAGEFGFGCLLPGHFDAGMKGRIVVGS
jgi:uncharacterized cupredoxin-like copper-binding protein